MHIFAIGDLHLSGEPQKKPMEIFGEHWAGHKEKIKQSWLEQVGPEDTVLICGDISWAMNLQEALVDLEWIAKLPGRKLLIRGNHDYWWTSLSKMKKQLGDSFEFVQNDVIMVDKIAVCGTRGWLLPSAESFSEEDDKIYKREGIRLELSLEAAKKLEPEAVVVMLHYPPLFAAEEETVFTQLMEKYSVKYCVYGHIHGENKISTYEGERRGVSYKLVSCDTQKFRLFQIL